MAKLDDEKEYLAKSIKRDAYDIKDLFDVIESLIQRVPEADRTPKEQALLNKLERADNKAQRIRAAKNRNEATAALSD